MRFKEPNMESNREPTARQIISKLINKNDFSSIRHSRASSEKIEENLDVILAKSLEELDTKVSRSLESLDIYTDLAILIHENYQTFGLSEKEAQILMKFLQEDSRGKDNLATLELLYYLLEMKQFME